MKLKAIALSLPLLLATIAFAYDNSPLIGTWKLNEGKSKIPAGAPKNTTVVYEQSGDNIKCTVDGVDANGQPTRSEWTGKFDGKDYPVSGDPTADTRTYTAVNSHTLNFVHKKGGKESVLGKIVVSADGKTRTVTTTSTDSNGKKVTSIAVYDKQ
jgi:hypothetical protein